MANALCVVKLESVTFKVKMKAPLTVGVPEICPVVPITARPGGNWPEETLQVYGNVPPAAWSVDVYAAPFVALARMDPVMVKTSGVVAATAMLNGFVATSPAESVALTVKEENAAEIGTPEISPVEAARPNPAGRAPVERLQV